MKHKLIYYFYIPKEDTSILKLHYECLKQYHDVFDSALFILAIDDINDKLTISTYEKKIIDLGFTNIEFKIYKNDPLLREVNAFKKEIIDKLDLLSDELIFFGHNKGTTNIENDSLKYWIVAMYYFNLYNIQYVDKIISNINTIVGYGAPACKIWTPNDGFNEYNNIFVGTMYWLSPAGILNLIKSKGYTLPFVANRFYAEDFFSNLLHADAENYLYPGNECWFINFIDWYNDAYSYLSNMDPTVFNEYLNFYEKIIKNINE